jgi:hypothetical protein
MMTSSAAADQALADLFEDRQAAAGKPPDINPFNTWNVRTGRAPGEGA